MGGVSFRCCFGDVLDQGILCSYRLLSVGKSVLRFRLQHMHDMLTILTDVRDVCHVA